MLPNQLLVWWRQHRTGFILTEDFRTTKATVFQGEPLSSMIRTGSALAVVLFEMGEIRYSILRLKFDVPDALCFGKVMSVQSCRGLSVSMLEMSPFRQNPKLLLKNEDQLYVTCENTKGVSHHCSTWKHLKWKLGVK